MVEETVTTDLKTIGSLKNKPKPLTSYKLDSRNQCISIASFFFAVSCCIVLLFYFFIFYIYKMLKHKPSFTPSPPPIPVSTFILKIFKS